MALSEFIDTHDRRWQLAGMGKILNSINLAAVRKKPACTMLQLHKTPIILSKATTGPENFFSYLECADYDGDYALIGIKYHIPGMFIKQDIPLEFAEFYLLRKIPLATLNSYDSLPNMQEIETTYRTIIDQLTEPHMLSYHPPSPLTNPHISPKKFMWIGAGIGIAAWITTQFMFRIVAIGLYGTP